jgi:hypothetical protein
MSKATNAAPWSVARDGSSKDQLNTWAAIAAPGIAPDNVSMSNASPYPLCPAIGRSDAALGNTRGSVVGNPCASTIQPGGIGFPCAAAAYTLPPATALVAMSSISGNGWPHGAANENGLLPSTALRPPGTVTDGVSFAIARPTIPSAAAIAV